MTQRKQAHEHSLLRRFKIVQFQRMQGAVPEAHERHLVGNERRAGSVQLEGKFGQRSGIGLQVHRGGRPRARRRRHCRRRGGQQAGGTADAREPVHGQGAPRLSPHSHVDHGVRAPRQNAVRGMRYQRPDVGGDGVRQAPQHHGTTLPYREAHGREGQAVLGSRGRHLDGGGPRSPPVVTVVAHPDGRVLPVIVLDARRRRRRRSGRRRGGDLCGPSQPSGPRPPPAPARIGV
mmetsp:Transcript_13929/g.33764  ORF Transcript_13929/g.33764 Transcript_13929/m.33764 type:complete len:233 (-) Transcript_13929:479-1177(-)